MAKRPSGFGKASKLKKQKSGDDNNKAAGVLEEEPEVNIELQDETSDEELAEVYGLYAKLKEERDPRFARGLVHECDQLLRSRDAKGESLPAKFHIAYAAALLSLADPEIDEKEDHEKLAEAGLERLQVGLDTAESDPAAKALAASELIQYVHTQTKDGVIKKTNKKLIAKAHELLKSDETHIEIARAALSLLQLADDCEDEPNLSEAAKSLLEQQLKALDAETKRIANEGLGQYYLNVVAPAMDALEDEDASDEDDNEANKSVKSDLKAALDHLKLAVTEAKPQTYVMLAETLLQWANFVDGEEEEAKVYAEGLSHLKKAQMLGVEDLHEVIDSLENPADD